MTVNPNIAEVAKLVTDPSRAAILTALLDDRFYTATELAGYAGIKQQTASFHLSKLLDAEMLTCRKQGRHRYYRLKDGKVAQSLETLLNIAPPAEIRSFRQSAEDRAVRKARTCYDHLAGSLGVTLAERLVEMGVLKEEETAFTVTEAGELFLKELGIDVGEVKKKRRSFCHKCLDWSERRHHIAGALGSALLDAFIRMGWIERRPRTRAVAVTPAGAKELYRLFHISIEKN
ncbi:winged helix-turn-helix domain-containing protein [Bacillus paralicheniformis]|uniref:Transcriptional regulator ArsR family n=1 Tax=Bacillus paralicheniformis TaxID=1648923 RepID=A0A7Z0X323_9BACI|nr:MULTISPECIES: winged helix-turn-helix domain-containing protein [Bacillus]KUL17825.1 ArsR family transcriptional regulator [Bacillus licheniformis LMG 6934]MBC8621460.1 winged helix-turn-helix transcriptional regulator [Robertmurraya crescens]KRT91038.1 ArsR family transcriptional regulator [Bacillus paralicheniformis]MBL7476240.1 winged helix-turn-helix transcriptional regulator [Bacillus paralicheniformis]MBR8665322.1 winged helix-turn-helix transcriptional regulator [Bacillus paralicheni